MPTRIGLLLAATLTSSAFAQTACLARNDQIGFFFAAQLATHDAGAAVPLPFVTSNALRLTVF